MSFEMVKTECREALRGIQEGKLDEADFAALLARIEAICDRLVGLDQRFGRGEIALLKSTWEMVHDPSFHASKTIWTAQSIMDRAFQSEVDRRERLRRAQASLIQMDVLAKEAPDPIDRPVVRRMMQPLVDLVAQLVRELPEKTE